MSLSSVFWGLILISDEPDDQERRQFQYLAQEKLSYITKYLEQTRDTDVYSLSTEDDSGKPGSNSAPSEFGFEETSTGMTLVLLAICPVARFHWAFAIKCVPREVSSGSISQFRNLRVNT